MKNDYARKILISRAVVSKAREAEIISNTTRIMLQVTAIAMNRVLGVGPDRFVRVQEEALKLFDEYSKMQDVDQEYADAKLQEGYDKIMRRQRDGNG